MDGLRKFLDVDNHEAVKVGGLQEGTTSVKVVKPKFTADFPGAVIREGADELTLRTHEEGVVRTFIDTANVEDDRYEPPLVDADWHAFCQAMCQGIEGQELETMCFHCKNLHQAAWGKQKGQSVVVYERRQR